MTAAILNFRPFAPRPQRDWTTQELAELYRIVDILQHASLPVATEAGMTEEGDPWFVFIRQDTDDVVAHFAKIDGEFIAASVIADKPLRGNNLRQIVDQLVASQPLLVPRPAGGGKGDDKIFLHPAVVLTAFVATALVHARQGDAGDLLDGLQAIGTGAGERYEGADDAGDATSTAVPRGGSDGAPAARNPGSNANSNGNGQSQQGGGRAVAGGNEIKVSLLSEAVLAAHHHTTVIAAVALAVSTLRAERAEGGSDAVFDYDSPEPLEAPLEVVRSGNAAFLSAMTDVVSEMPGAGSDVVAVDATLENAAVSEPDEPRPVRAPPTEIPDAPVTAATPVGILDIDVGFMDLAALDAAAAAPPDGQGDGDRPLTGSAAGRMRISAAELALVEDRLDDSAETDSAANLSAILGTEAKPSKPNETPHIPDGEVPHKRPDEPSPVPEPSPDDGAAGQDDVIVGGGVSEQPGQRTETVADSSALADRILEFAVNQRFAIEDAVDVDFLSSFLRQSDDVHDNVALGEIDHVVLFESETNTADLITFRGNMLMIDHAIFDGVNDFANGRDAPLNLSIISGNTIELIGAVAMTELDPLV